MPVRYMKRSTGVGRLWALICVMPAPVVRTITYFQVAQGRFPLASAASQIGSELVSFQQNSTTGISSALESSASMDSRSSSSAAMNTLTYINKEYSFTFVLPQNFEGYTILNGEWEGTDIKDTASKVWVFKGPQTTIRDPWWTGQVSRQDIPIMILTVGQWNQLQNEEFSVGAAPVDPSELSQNSKYVFALPVRCNCALPEGYEEV